MATSKTIQKPVILGLEASSIRIAHPDISKFPNTQLTAQIAAAGNSMTVNDTTGFADNDWMIVGEIGDNRTETCDVNGAVSAGTSITITNNLDHAHEVNTSVAKILARGITIYGALTDGGSGTIIKSIDDITASGKQLADAKMISWNANFTEYTFITTDTAYAYYYVVFTDGTTESAASDYIPSTGWTDNRVIKMVQEALDETDTQLDNKNITLQMCTRWANEAQRKITQFKYQDPVTGMLQHVDWDFEVIEDAGITVATGETEYNLSDLTNTLKYVDSDRAVISVRMGDRKAMKKMTIDEWDSDMEDKPRTEIATQAEIADTSLVVDSNVEFSTTGTLFIEDDEITYTGKTGTTTFTGVPASGSGSITAQHVVDIGVWQSMSPEEPKKWVIFNGKLFLTVNVKSDWNNYPLKMRIYKALTALSEASDATEVSFYNVFHMFIASRIERRKGNEQQAMLYMQEFEANVLNNALANNVPPADAQDYYNFVSDDNLGRYNDTWNNNL